MTAHTRRLPLRLRPQLSRRLATFIGVTHGVAVAVLLLLPIPWYGRGAGVLFVTGSFVYQVWVHLLHRGPRAVRAASWAADGTWTLSLPSGGELEATLAPSTFVGTSLVVLNFRCGRWRRYALVLLPDNLDATLLRRLRVRLRLIGGNDGAADGGPA
jgi:toxin CptA